MTKRAQIKPEHLSDLAIAMAEAKALQAQLDEIERKHHEPPHNRIAEQENNDWSEA